MKKLAIIPLFLVAALLFLVPVSASALDRPCDTNAQCLRAFGPAHSKCSTTGLCVEPTGPEVDTVRSGLQLPPGFQSEQAPSNRGNGQGGEGSGTLDNPVNAPSLEALMLAFLRFIVQIGSIILVLALVWSGLLFTQAQGNEEKIRSARTTLVWTIVGGLFLLGAEAIALVIGATAQNLAI